VRKSSKAPNPSRGVRYFGNALARAMSASALFLSPAADRCLATSTVDLDPLLYEEDPLLLGAPQVGIQFHQVWPCERFDFFVAHSDDAPDDKGAAQVLDGAIVGMPQRSRECEGGYESKGVWHKHRAGWEDRHVDVLGLSRSGGRWVKCHS